MLSLVTKLELYSLDKRTAGWAKTCLDSQAWRLAANGSHTTRRLQQVHCCMTVPEPVLSSSLLSDLEEVEYSSIRLAADIKLGRTDLRAGLSCRGTETGWRNRLTQEHYEIL